MKKYKNRTNLFYSMDYIYSMRLISKKVKGSKAIKTSHNNFNEILKELANFQKTHQYKYNKSADKKTYRNRVGVFFEILLPLDLSKTKYNEFANKTIRYAMGEDYNKLPYYAYIEKKGKGSYLCIFIIEREYFVDGKPIKKRAKSDIYKNKITHAFCKKENELAYLAIKKGTVTSCEFTYFSNKVDRYMLGNNTAKKKNIHTFRKKFLIFLENTFISLNVNFTNEFFMHGLSYRGLTLMKKKGILSVNAFIKQMEKKINSIEEGICVNPEPNAAERQLLQNLYHYVENSLYLGIKRIYKYGISSKNFTSKMIAFIDLNSKIFHDLIVATEINLFESFA